MMKKKKVAVKVKERNLDFTIYTNGLDVEIVRDLKGNLYFKVGKELSSDVAEGVALLMRHKKSLNDKELWAIDVKDNGYNTYPEKALYWLSGGDTEWNLRDNYKKTWGESYCLFQEQFGLTICDIINESKTLGEVKTKFQKQLNILNLYEFALDKGIA
jgi:hypothetical protein